MKKPLWVVILVLVVVASSCSSRLGVLERSTDFEVLYNGAIAYFEQGKYNQAKLLFERISPYYRGSEKAEKVKFYWAYSEFYSRFYELSAFHFKDFYQTYNRSKFAEEAEFMEAYSLYQNSPDANLDQSSSERAVVAMQNFLNRRPTTKYFKEATDIINELQVRFETKAYNKAKLYYKLTAGLSYKNYLEAALVSFDSFKKDFPDSKYNEELLFLSMETSFKLAENSLETVQAERYTRTIDFYNDLAQKYPSSTYLDQAKEMFDKSQSELTALKSTK